MLIIVTALLCEAKPIISKYNLKCTNDIAPYPVYQNDGITLIVSGIGKIAVAGACGYIAGFSRTHDNSESKTPFTSWLNIGLAGHAKLDIGMGFLAHRIIDEATNKTFYPSIVFNPPCHTDDLTTVDKASADYITPGGVDMEAAGFYATANRYSNSELIQSFKVVSDNPATPLKKFSKNEASDLINNKINLIQALIEQLSTLQKSLPQPFSELKKLKSEYDKILSLHHFTHTEKLQLKNQLIRLSLLNNQSSLMANHTITKNTASAKEILKKLDKHITQQPIIFN